MIQNNERNFEAMIAEMEKTLGPPPILSWEDEAEYYRLMRLFWDELKPKHRLSMLFLSDATNATWNDTRWARHRAYTIERSFERLRSRAARVEAISKKQEGRREVAKEAQQALQAGEVNADEARGLQLEAVFEETVEEVDECLARETDDRDGARALQLCAGHVGWLAQQQAAERQARNVAFQLYEYFEERLGPTPTTEPPIIDGKAEHVEDAPPLVPADAPPEGEAQ